MKKAIIVIPSLALLFVLALHISNQIIPRPETTITSTLDEIVPNQIAGWKIEKVPLAETEEMKRRVDELLRFDDHVSRNYIRQSDKAEFTVYIGYWKPGKATVSEVNTHTPDICWSANGWKMVPLETKTINLSGLHTGQYRRFRKSAVEIDVAYWHLVGGQTYVNEGVISKRFKMDSLIAPLNLGTNVRGEQIFLRISTKAKGASIDSFLLEQLGLTQFLSLSDS